MFGVAVYLGLLLHTLGPGLLAAENSSTTPVQTQQESFQLAQANDHFEKAKDFSRQGRLEEALLEFDKALDLYQRADKKNRIVECLIRTGELLRITGQPKESIARLTQALAYFQRDEVTSPPAEADAYRHLAWAFYELSRYDSARANFDTAIYKFEQLMFVPQQADCYFGRGLCYLRQSKYDSAIPEFQNAASRFKDLDDSKRVNDCRFFIGHCLFQLQDFDSAVDSLSVFVETADDTAKLANAHFWLGVSLYSLHHYEQAVPEFQSAATYFSLANDIAGHLQSVLKLAELFHKTKQFQKALEQYDVAIATADTSEQQRSGRIARIRKANLMFHELGETQQSRLIFEEALSLSRVAEDSNHLAASLTGLANILYMEGKYQEALDYYMRIDSIYSGSGDSIGLVRNFLNIGNVHKSMGDLDKAEEFYLRSQNLSEQLDVHETLAISFNNLGSLDFERKEYVGALYKFEQAEKFAGKAFADRLLLTTHSNKGITYEQTEQYEKACTAYAKAIDMVEEIEKDLQEEELANSFINSKADLYDRMISLLFDHLDDPQAAVGYIDRSRSGGLLESYRLLFETSGQDRLVALVDSLHSARKRVQDAELDLQRELSKPRRQRDARLISRRHMDIRESELEAIMLADRLVKASGVTALPLIEIYNVKRKIPEDVVIVIYYPSTDTLNVCVWRPEKFVRFRVNVPRETLVSMVSQYRSLIEDYIRRVMEEGRIPQLNSWQDSWIEPLKTSMTTLYQYLIEPIESQVREGDTLLLIPTLNLNYIPLHALAEERDDGSLSFVLERWKIAYISSMMASTFGKNMELRQDKESCFRAITAFGNSDGKLGGVKREFASLRQFAPEAQIFSGSESTVERAARMFGKSCIFVISDHSDVNPRNVTQSYIKFADGNLTLDQIHNHLPGSGDGPDLVLLPNCETAMGEKDPTAGLHNLVQGFNKAGANSVLATLWPVYDNATADLMHEFYKNYIGKRLDKEESLRLAQLSLLSQPETRHPFFWAGFMMFGYWPEDNDTQSKSFN